MYEPFANGLQGSQVQFRSAKKIPNSWILHSAAPAFASPLEDWGHCAARQRLAAELAARDVHLYHASEEDPERRHGDSMTSYHICSYSFSPELLDDDDDDDDDDDYYYY